MNVDKQVGVWIESCTVKANLNSLRLGTGSQWRLESRMLADKTVSISQSVIQSESFHLQRATSALQEKQKTKSERN